MERSGDSGAGVAARVRRGSGGSAERITSPDGDGSGIESGDCGPRKGGSSRTGNPNSADALSDEHTSKGRSGSTLAGKAAYFRGRIGEASISKLARRSSGYTGRAEQLRTA
jgi:hypothetical protein